MYKVQTDININKNDSKTAVGFMKKLYKNKALMMMMLPLFAVQIINGYLPLFGLTIAFKNIDYSKGIFFSDWAGLDNFKFLFATKDIWKVFRNTIGYNLVFILLGMILAVGLSLMLNEIKNKLLSKTYQTLMILPNFLSMVVVSYVIYALLAPEYGFVNKMILPRMGIEPIDWYGKASLWPYIIVIIRMWHNVGYGSIIYLAVLTGLDQSMFEAACIDGANKWQEIRYITFPMLLPVMTIVLILSLGDIIKGDFGLFYQVPLNSAQLYGATDIIDTYVYRALVSLGDVGMSSAVGFLQSVIGCIMVVLANGFVRLIDKEQALF